MDNRRPQSKSDQVKDYILEKIRTGVFTPNDRIPSVTELARTFSINRNTAVKALNELASAGVIYQRQGHGSFAAPGNGKKRTRNIAVIVSRLTSPIYSNIISALEKQCVSRSLHLIPVSHGASGEVQRRELARLIDHDKVDAIILFPASAAKEDIQFLEAIRRKGTGILVLTPRTFTSDVVSSMNFDLFEGMEASVNHLIENGYRRIGLVTAAYQMTDGRERFYGYRNALEKAGLPFRPDYVFYVEDADEEHADKAAEAIVSHPDRPDALAVISDEVAVGLINRFLEMGIKVPRDIAMTAGGNIPLGAHPLYSLTTIAPDFDVMAQQIMACLTRQIQAPDTPPDHLVFRQQLIVRGSSGPTASMQC
ncbi:MAG: GntR family transcriptional regulator [Candidatus Pacebacteria bacterium]|nr:GntR family transcriptional regulator [Candidatus Paceibacterota bacterium]